MFASARFLAAIFLSSAALAAHAATTLDPNSPSWVLFDMQGHGVGTTLEFDFTTTGHETDLQLSIVDLGVVGDMYSWSIDGGVRSGVTSSVTENDALTAAQFLTANTTGTVKSGSGSSAVACSFANLTGTGTLAGSCASRAERTSAGFSYVSHTGFVVNGSGNHVLTLTLSQTDKVAGVSQGSFGLICLNADGIENCGSPSKLLIASIPEPASTSLALAGLAVVVGISRRRRRASARA